MGIDAKDFTISKFRTEASYPVSNEVRQDLPEEEEVSSRVIVVERGSGRIRIAVPAGIELTFSVINSSTKGNFREEYGRDLRFYQRAGTRKNLVATLTGVTDFFDPKLLRMQKWNPKLEREIKHVEDNSSSSHSSVSTITGGWESYLDVEVSEEEIPF